MEVSLLSSGIPNLLPSRDRSPGIHHSDVLSDLLTREGYYAPRDPWSVSGIPEHTLTIMQLGQAFEDILVDRYRRHYGPRYYQPGELEIDGLPITLDLADTLYHGPDEIKYTRLSSRHLPTSDEFMRFQMQIKSQCIAMEPKTLSLLTGRLHICHAMGSYDYKNPAVHFNVWKCGFTRAELEIHRTRILRHRDRMLREGWTEERR